MITLIERENQEIEEKEKAERRKRGGKGGTPKGTPKVCTMFIRSENISTELTYGCVNFIAYIYLNYMRSL